MKLPGSSPWLCLHSLHLTNTSFLSLSHHQFQLPFPFSLSPSPFSLSTISTMKLIGNLPKKLFRSKKSRSLSRSEDPLSFSSATTSSESSISSESVHKEKSESKPNGLATPTSVLPSKSSGTVEFSDISAEMQLELVQAFGLIDRDGDGKVTREELEAFLSRVGAEPPSAEELTMMLSEIDRDGDGCISLEEFGAISSAFGPPTCDAELRDAFDFFDTDHDGRITAEELLKVFSVMGDDQCTLEDCRRMISGVDSNGDGFVCFEDFTRMMEQQR